MGNQENHWRRNLEHLLDRLDQHGMQMEADPDYAVTVHYVLRRLAARQDRVGQAVRVLIATQARLAKTL